VGVPQALLDRHIGIFVPDWEAAAAWYMERALQARELIKASIYCIEMRFSMT